LAIQENPAAAFVPESGIDISYILTSLCRPYSCNVLFIAAQRRWL
jgi:hypothetical protein